MPIYATTIEDVVPLHSDANIDSEITTIIPGDTTIAILEKGDVWSKAIYNEYTGYLLNCFLKFESEGEDKIVLSLSRENAQNLYLALKLSLNQ